MKADFSRNTYQPGKHYRRVLGQQGRVVIDADLNEQTSIGIAALEQTTYDVIGPTGVPNTSLSYGYNGGFQIGIAPSGTDLTISHGRMYVDGLLVENDSDTNLSTQPFLPLPPGGFGPAGLTGPGLYAAYIDAWERVVTPVDDSEIVEIALGGPDTALRSQVAWQVKFGLVDTSEFGTNPSCAQILPPWGFGGNQGTLTAQGGAPSTDPLPCVLPPQTGYQSLENQLYRVEIHTPGGYGTATFKWSRENGSVIAGIASAATTPTSSPAYNVTTVGRDTSLGFAVNDWVEVIDDDSEFQTGAGQLLQCANVQGLTITLSAAPNRPIDFTKHPKLRRWDQSANATGTGVPIADGRWMTLENGVQVQFSNGRYNVGDYWLIPARTATSADTMGTIEWPADPVTSLPLSQVPLGVQHYYASLGIVAFDGTKFSPPQGATSVTDCRIFFPPLTSVQTQASPCTLVLAAGSNWVCQINALFSGQPALDAEICFTTGTFTTSAPVVITTTGNVKVSGAGWGTQLVGSDIEAVLQFVGCKTAVVRDLTAAAASVDAPPDAKVKASRVIHGALDFNGCGEVLVENVSLTCGAALLPGAACVVVRSDPTVNVTTGTGVARIRGSTFTVGEMQYGILLVHQQRAYVEDNVIQAAPSTNITWKMKMAQASFRTQLARTLVGEAMVYTKASSSSSSSSSGGAAAPAVEQRAVELAVKAPMTGVGSGVHLNAGVTVAGKTIAFTSPAAIAGVWQTYVDLHGPKEFANASDLYSYVRKSAVDLVTNEALLANYPSLQSFIGNVRRGDVVAGARGIAVGGRGITELRICDNSIGGMIAGIVVGVSHREKRPPALPADAMQKIGISGNTIDIVVPAVAASANSRYAIFVGNAANVAIESNSATARSTTKPPLPCDGIRVWGYLGKKMVVRQNHTTGFTRDIFVRALLPTGPVQQAVYWYTAPPAHQSANANLWLVADNMCDRNVIVAPACMLSNNWP